MRLVLISELEDTVYIGEDSFLSVKQKLSSHPYGPYRIVSTSLDRKTARVLSSDRAETVNSKRVDIATKAAEASPTQRFSVKPWLLQQRSYSTNSVRGKSKIHQRRLVRCFTDRPDLGTHAPWSTFTGATVLLPSKTRIASQLSLSRAP